jgi:hypothetical protein
MHRTYVSLLLALALSSAPVFALSQAEATAIAEKVIGLNDAEATKAFQALNEKGVFKVSDSAGDVAREIAFRVLELNDPALNGAFNYLKGKGAFEQPPVGGLTAQDRIKMDAARQAAAACRGQLDLINPLVAEYNASWIPGRLRIRKQIGVTLEQARAYLNRAQGHFAGYGNRTEPEIRAVGAEVEGARKEFNEYIDWWNTEFANQ